MIIVDISDAAKCVEFYILLKHGESLICCRKTQAYDNKMKETSVRNSASCCMADRHKLTRRILELAVSCDLRTPLKDLN